MQVSKEKKVSLNFFLRFWNLYQILNILKKTDDPQSLRISDIMDWESRG